MSKYNSRLQSLERALLHTSIETEVDEFMAADHVQQQITDAADRYSVDRHHLANEMRKHEIRIRQVGWNAYHQETAAALGLPLEVVTDHRARMEHLDKLKSEHAAYWADMRSKQVYWRAGVEYRGGEPVDRA